jgi:hypothetical protein
MDAQRFLRGRLLPKDKNDQHNNTQMLLIFAYNGHLFIGGWKDFSQLVLSVNGNPLEVLPIPSSKKWLRSDQIH